MTDSDVKNESATTAAAFRAKAAFMKTWKPQSTPSNRDRLELYALHKQAVSGDAPTNIPQDASVASKAKFQAWRTKRGLSQTEAMTLYCQECDRQIRLYGNATSTTPATPQNTPAARAAAGQAEENSTLMPRGLAAIPLLCAAAAESRASYLRRLSHTSIENAWWARQEPLCAPPGTLIAIPEALLIAVASFVEYLSLSGVVPLPASVVQSYLWPLHHSFLNLWILVILVITALSACVSLLSTLLWGYMRTGISLEEVWREEISTAANAASALCEPHQPIVTRMAGLVLMPYGVVVGMTQAIVDVAGTTVGSLVYVAIMVFMTWWYWLFVIPWLGICLLGGAIMSGSCFALIDFAGV